MTEQTTVTVPVLDLPLTWHLNDNPRVNRTGIDVAKKIKNTLLGNPELFSKLNRGILLINDESVVDGGTTYNVIREVVSDKKYLESLRKASVRVEYMSAPQELIPAISDARNNVTKVKESDFLNASGSFDEIKELLRGHQYTDYMSFKTGCYGVDDTPITFSRPAESIGGLIHLTNLLKILESQVSTTDSTHYGAVNTSGSGLIKRYKAGVYKSLYPQLPHLVNKFVKVRMTVKTQCSIRKDNRLGRAKGIIMTCFYATSLIDDFDAFWERHGVMLTDFIIDQALNYESGISPFTKTNIGIRVVESFVKSASKY